MNILTRFRELVDWLSVADYAAAKEQATDEIVARYSRGNVSVQSGDLLDKERLKKLSAEGDKAMSRLQKIVSAGQRNSAR